MTTVGIMSAGAMGSAVGAAYLAGGARVVTTLAGRSPRTADLAEQAGLEVLDDVAAVVGASDLVLSIVPPGQARASAASLAGARLLVEANAVAPATVQDIASYGVPVVDGSISGGPPRPGHGPRTRLYLSGPRAQEVADVPAPWLDVRVVGPEIGTASAVKMCTAAYYKGRIALAAQSVLAAQALGVTDQVLDDLGDTLPGPGVVAAAATKAWRFVDEMREITATQGSVGLPEALFEGMAQVYELLAARAAGQQQPAAAGATWAEVLAALRAAD